LGYELKIQSINYHKVNVPNVKGLSRNYQDGKALFSMYDKMCKRVTT